jgi:hypothetical protein
MDNINILAHESHLESQNGWVIAIVGQDEMDCITICNPHKALPKQHVTVFVNSLVAGKPLPQVGMQVDFVPATLSATKSNGANCGGRVLCHKREIQTRAKCNHGGIRCFISPWLADNVAKALGQENWYKGSDLRIGQTYRLGRQRI